ncbi:asparagine--tRNA ligase [Candidatus Peregrinibacteria bacterium CG08_land_8_20_14_0_20_41_10]|nr:MAG: asparagine--tRNA ligase [Candidatus Peregrinibacteria bacterium CG08_land_8_20_14_0_20_41_10]
MLTAISQIKQFVSQEVTLKGWMFNKRGSGKIYFLQIRDGTGTIQAIVDAGTVSSEVFQLAEKLTLESSLEITGKVTPHPKNPEEYELQVTDLKIIQLVTEEYPIAKKEHGPDFLLENRHLWLRSPKQRAIQVIRDTIIRATYQSLHRQNFIKIDSPILTPSACEGTTTLFEIDYFGKPAYLSQSGQLYLEAAIFSVGRCFDFGPVFRAEKSKTRRHLIEFWMMDAEEAFVEHEGNMQIQEQLICDIVTQVLEENQTELKILERDIKPLEKIKAPFVHLSHTEAIQHLRKLGSDIKDRDDLGGDDETLLTKQFEQPIFVEKYPAEIKAFYMKRDKAGEFALNNDLLAPEGYGEIVGGSQREDDYSVLLERIKEHKLPVEAFSWYLDLRKYGSVPHSGFGYGLERIVTWLCGLDHVRESIPFPRLLNRCYP